MNRRLKKAQFRDLYLYVQKQIKNEMKPPLSSKLFSFAIVIVEVDVFFFRVGSQSIPLKSSIYLPLSV